MHVQRKRRLIDRFFLRGLLGLTCLWNGAIYADEQPSDGAPMPALSELIGEAKSLQMTGQWDEAIQLFQQAVDRADEDEAVAAEAQIQIGRCYLSSGRYAEAQAALLSAIDEFPNQAEAQFQARLFRVDALREQVLLEEALAQADEFLAMPSLSEDQRAWASIKHAEIGITAMYHGKGKRSEVIDAFAQIADVDETSEPHNWARIRLSELFYHDRKFNEAVTRADEVVADFNQGKATDEQAAWALFWKGCCQIDAGSADQAASTLQAAYGLASGKHPYISYMSTLRLAKAYRAFEDHAKALTQFQTALNDAVRYNLEESLQDDARLEVGAAYEALGYTNSAIAWLRSGIDDPARMDGRDKELSDQIAELLPGVEKESWRLYLVDPTNRIDPTSAFVESEFNEAASSPSQTITNASTRLRWLGDFYYTQKRYDEALRAYQDSLDLAMNATDRAYAGWGQIQSMQRLAIQFQKENNPRRVRLLRVASKSLADSLMPDWTELALNSPVGDAHHAIESAARGYKLWRMNADALEAVDHILEQLSAQGAHEARIAFARYMKLRVLSWLQLYEEAIDLSEQIDADYRNSGIPVIERIRVSSLMRGALYHAKLGQADTGQLILDSLKAEHPEGTFDEPINRVSGLIQNH